MLKKIFHFLFFGVLFLQPVTAQVNQTDNLVFDSLPKRWDEALPLGNGMLGALIWEKEGKLRFSLDRGDLWDERPALDLSKFNFKWVQQQVAINQYDTVHKLGDDPYEQYPYPTKLPAGAIEFEISSFGKVARSGLDISNATCKIKWENGVELQTYVCANSSFGVFKFKNIAKDVPVAIVAPPYNSGRKGFVGNSVEGQGLERLGYEQGKITRGNDFLHY